MAYVQKQPPEVLFKKNVHKDVTKFKEIYQCLSVFLRKFLVNFAKFLRKPFL